MSETVEITKDDLQRLIEAAIRAAKAPNVLEQQAIDAEIEKQKRRDKLTVELARVEEEVTRRRKHGCTHSRVPQGQRNAGAPCPRGQGEWVTGGQLVGRDEAMLICQRCSWGWKFKTTFEEREYINSVGMLGMPPPPPDRVIWEG